MRLFAIILVGVLSQSTAHAFCEGPGYKLTNVCNKNGNRYGVCVTENNNLIVIKVANYAGARWGFNEAPMLLPTNVPNVWKQPAPTNRPWKDYEKQFTLEVAPNGKDLRLYSIEEFYGHTSKPWIEELSSVNCPDSMIFNEDGYIFASCSNLLNKGH